VCATAGRCVPIARLPIRPGPPRPASLSIRHGRLVCATLRRTDSIAWQPIRLGPPQPASLALRARSSPRARAAHTGRGRTRRPLLRLCGCADGARRAASVPRGAREGRPTERPQGARAGVGWGGSWPIGGPASESHHLVAERSSRVHVSVEAGVGRGGVCVSSAQLSSRATSPERVAVTSTPTEREGVGRGGVWRLVGPAIESRSPLGTSNGRSHADAEGVGWGGPWAVGVTARRTHPRGVPRPEEPPQSSRTALT
jgi:hypothetical protein